MTCRPTPAAATGAPSTRAAEPAPGRRRRLRLRLLVHHHQPRRRHLRHRGLVRPVRPGRRVRGRGWRHGRLDVAGGTVGSSLLQALTGHGRSMSRVHGTRRRRELACVAARATHLTRRIEVHIWWDDHLGAFGDTSCGEHSTRCSLAPGRSPAGSDRSHQASPTRRSAARTTRTSTPGRAHPRCRQMERRPLQHRIAQPTADHVEVSRCSLADPGLTRNGGRTPREGRTAVLGGRG